MAMIEPTVLIKRSAQSKKSRLESGLLITQEYSKAESITRLFLCRLPLSELTYGARKIVWQEYTPVSSDKNIQLMRRWFQEVWNAHPLRTPQRMGHPRVFLPLERGTRRPVPERRRSLHRSGQAEAS